MVITNAYSAANDLSSSMSGNGWLSTYGYNTHHAVVTTTQQLGQPADPGCPHPHCGDARPRRGHPRPLAPQGAHSFAYVSPTDGIERRGSLTTYDSYGEVTAVLSAVALPFGVAPPPTRAPLATRVRYIHKLVADAEYALATTPRVYMVGHWKLAVVPDQPDPQAAWDAIRRIAPVAFDQPEVPSLLEHIQLNMQLVAQTASNAQQMHEVYTPDYTPVRDLLDLLDTDVDAALVPLSPAAGDQGICPLCAVP